MKVLVMIFFMIIFSGFAQSQISSIYSFNNKDKNIDYYICFYKDGSYLIEISKNVTLDIIEVFVLSDGYYLIKDNIVIFTDRIHGYKMEMVLNKNELIVKKSFNFLINKKFIYYEKNMKSKYHYNTCNINTLKLERNVYKTQNNDLHSLEYGTYESAQGFKLDIFQSDIILQLDNQYQLYFKDVMISNGTWNRVENELVLYDTTLNHQFYLLIGDKVLISKLLPGDYSEGCLMKLNK